MSDTKTLGLCTGEMRLQTWIAVYDYRDEYCDGCDGCELDIADVVEVAYEYGEEG